MSARGSMPVRHLIAAAFLACCPAGSAARENAEAQCPDFPANSDFTWRHTQGPDFEVCYAQEKNNPSAGLIGVYLGFAPSFRPDRKLVGEDGKIDGTTVHWYVKHVNDPAFKLGVETLLEIKPSVAHIWLLAQDQESLSNLMRVVGGLNFKKYR